MQNSSTRWWRQITIREMLAVAAIICIAAGFAIERKRNIRLQHQIDGFFPTPHVRVYDPTHRDKYSVGANVVINGRLFLPTDFTLEGPAQMVARLLHPTTGEVVSEVEGEIEPGESFYHTFPNPGGITPGNFPLVVNVLDNGEVIASSVTLIVFAD